MKKIILLLLFVLCWSMPAAAIVRHIQDNYKFVYSVANSAGAHVTAQTVALKIQRTSDSFWLDFSDLTFKNSGWTNKTTNLTEDSTNGIYYYLYNPPASESVAEEYVFVIDNGSTLYGDHQAFAVTYQNIGTSTFAHASNQVTVATNNDKTGYSISGTKTTLDALNDITAASVWAVGTRTLTALDEDSTTIDIDGSTIGTVTNVSDKTGYRLSATGVDDIWDEAIAGHLTVGSTGEKLNASGAAGDPWATDLPGSYTGLDAGAVLSGIKNSTDGDKESGVYTGIETMIRVNR